MRLFLSALRVLGWVCLAFVALKVVAASYLNYHGGMSMGVAIAAVLESFMLSSEAKDRVYFYAAVLGIAFIVKARVISAAMRKAGGR